MKRNPSDKPYSFDDWMKAGEVPMPVKKMPAAGMRTRPSSAVLASDTDSDEAYYAEMTRYTQNGVADKQLRWLRRQQPQDKLDLHGLTVAEASEALALFLTRSCAGGMRVVEIVHGRGNHSPAGQRGRLRAKTRQWCCQSPVVLAYNEMPHNPGALIVLLKKGG